MNKLRSVPVLALCALFLFLAAGSALLSSSVYRSVEEAAGSHSAQRVTMSYILSRLRAGDTAQGVRISTFGGGDALVLPEGEYETTLYCYDGYLRELYAAPNIGLEPEAGEPIVLADELLVTLEAELLQLSIVDGSGEVIQAEYRVQSSGWEVDAP